MRKHFERRNRCLLTVRLAKAVIDWNMTWISDGVKKYQMTMLTISLMKPKPKFKYWRLSVILIVLIRLKQSKQGHLRCIDSKFLLEIFHIFLAFIENVILWNTYFLFGIKKIKIDATTGLLTQKAYTRTDTPPPKKKLFCYLFMHTYSIS